MTTTEYLLSMEGYERWLRAGRPQPISWFLALSETEQGMLAEIGDRHAQDLCVAIGVAVAGEVAPQEGEEEMVRRLVAGALGPIVEKSKVARPMPEAPQAPTTLAGMVARRMKAQEEADAAEMRAHATGRSLFGRPPAQATRAPQTQGDPTP